MCFQTSTYHLYYYNLYGVFKITLIGSISLSHVRDKTKTSFSNIYYAVIYSYALHRDLLYPKYTAVDGEPKKGGKQR